MATTATAPAPAAAAVPTTTATTMTNSTTKPNPIYVDTQHEDFVHDAQLDYYGSKLATCSSDRTIKIYNVFNSSYELSATLQGHEGPVWQVSWSHPKFGVILASCSFDGSVLVHREARPNEWAIVYHARGVHESSVNGIAFAPQEFGYLMLAAASSDGRVSILRHDPNQQWLVDYIQDCPMGVNAVSWAPHGAYAQASAAANAAEQPEDDAAAAAAATADVAAVVESPRIVTAGCDNQIRFWVQDQTTGQWNPEGTTSTSTVTHTDWVRDVAWAPCLLPNHNMVASCSEDRTVLIWKQQSTADGNNKEWVATLLNKFDAPVWRVSWSVTGHLLAVSSGDSDVTLWKAGLDGKWTQVSSVTEEEDQQQQHHSAAAPVAVAAVPGAQPPQQQQ